jgi:hypothetical protein
MSRPSLSWVWLWLLFVIPSLQIVSKFGHKPGLALYLVVSALAVKIGFPWLTQKIRSHPNPDKLVQGLVIIATLFFAGALVTLYPLSHSGKFGAGNDRADALNVGIDRLLHGLYPYTGLTYLKQAITPLPGSFILALPFWAIHDSAYQNLLWMPLLFILFSQLGKKEVALPLWLGVVFLCPIVFEEMIVGGDYATNSIFVACSTMLLLHAAESKKTAHGVLAAILWGICICSRLNYLLIILPVAIYLANRIGLGKALLLTGTGAAVLAGLALPFYFMDPTHFSPLHVTQLVNGSERAPNQILAAEAVGFLLPGLATVKFAKSRESFAFVLAGTLLFPTLVAFAVRTLHDRSLSLDTLSLAAAGVVFAAIGYALGNFGLTNTVEA